MTAAERANKALNKLCKWRTILVGRLLGTRPNDDPEAQGYRDLFDKLLILRAEVSAITKLLLDRGRFTKEELADAVATEAEVLADLYEQTFPGLRACDEGIEFTNISAAKETMRRWKP